jgi:hypothetical protein
LKKVAESFTTSTHCNYRKSLQSDELEAYEIYDPHASIMVARVPATMLSIAAVSYLQYFNLLGSITNL